MRIAIVSPYSWAHPGGVNNHIEGLARSLLTRGHGVTIIAPDEGPVPEGASFATAGASVPVPANGSVARLALRPSVGARVSEILCAGPYDVVHVHEPLVPLVSTTAVAAARCPLVATFHAAREGRSAAYLLGGKVFGRGVDRIDARIAVSEPARSLASRYLPGEYRIVPNGVNLSRFSPARAPGGRNASEILFVGRAEKRKGLKVLLEAFPAVCERVPGARIKAIGSGLDPSEVRAGLPPSLRDRIEVPGFVSNEELAGHYAAAEVFCAPALGGESFGIVLAEAMACGTPVVASDIAGYAAVVRETGGGVLFSSGCARDCARALVELLIDPDRRRKLGAAGLAGVGGFSWEKVSSRIEETYEAISAPR